MGTLVSIQAFGSDERMIHAAMNAAFADMRRLDALLSVYNPSSEISEVNAQAGRNAVTVSPETLEILQHALRFSVTTNSVFDCTVEPLMRLWGFRGTDVSCQHPPSDADIQSVLDSIGYKNISVHPESRSVGILKNKGAIDLGGIAVGYSVDRMANILKREGITSAIIDHSGDIAAIGTPPESDGWIIGIPSVWNRGEIIHRLTIRDQAISTSGSSEQYRIVDGRHRSHIIDTASGAPSELRQSVSVIAQSSMTADVYSTALFLSEKRVRGSKNSGTKLEYIQIDSDNTINTNFISLHDNEENR